MLDRRINVIWMDRVVVRENGIVVDVPHVLNADTGTHAVCRDLSHVELYEAGIEAGMYMAQQLPRELLEQLNALDVNLNENLDEDDGLFEGQPRS